MSFIAGAERAEEAAQGLIDAAANTATGKNVFAAWKGQATLAEGKSGFCRKLALETKGIASRSVNCN